MLLFFIYKYYPPSGYASGTARDTRRRPGPPVQESYYMIKIKLIG